MALERKNRVKQKTTTTGTGTISLPTTYGDSYDGFLLFSGTVTDGATVRYLIESSDSLEWEVGEGVFTLGALELTRDTVFISSTGGTSLVDFSAGTKTVSLVLTAEDIVDPSNSIITNETPSGALDSSDTTYTLANSPVAGTLAVYLNGQRLTYTDDYTLATNVITFVVPPASGDIIRADYLLAGAGSGNADTLDNQHAPTGTIVGHTDTQTLSNKTLTAPVINGAITGDAIATGTTIASGTENDAIVTAKALADATIGKLGAAWTDWVPTFANFTKGSATIEAKYVQIGKTVHFRLGVKLAADSSMGTTPTFTLPVTSVSYGVVTATMQVLGVGRMLDSGTASYEGACIWGTTTTAQMRTYGAAGTYLNSTTWTSTVPFTWATNDEFYFTGTYEAA